LGRSQRKQQHVVVGGGGRCFISMGGGRPKNFKYKPVPPPRPKIPTREELFGEQGIPAGGYLLLIIPVSTLALGVWQVYRWKWKLQLIEVMEAKVHALPTDFPFSDLESLESMEYRKVKLRGKFDYGKEALMGPRSLFNYATEHATQGGLMSSNQGSPPGYHIVTPFHLEGQNLTILVNRGWIPDKISYKYRGTDDNVEIVGVVRKKEARQPFMPKDDKQKTLLFRNVPLMAEMLGTEEVFLDLVSISGVDLSTARLHNLPVPGQTRVALRNEHVSYFYTWFSLSAITAYMWYRRFILRQPLK